MNLKRENITLAENGDMWIKITRQKTNIPSIIPVMDIAKSIIKKYENQNDSYVLLCDGFLGLLARGHQQCGCSEQGAGCE